jgi:hypothetical protein
MGTAMPCTHALLLLSLPLSLLCSVRSKAGVEFRAGPLISLTPTTGGGLRTAGGDEGQLLYANDGSKVAIVTAKDVQIIDANTLKEIATIVSKHAEAQTGRESAG